MAAASGVAWIRQDPAPQAPAAAEHELAPGAHDLKELGIEPTALELIVPTYLRRFRRTAWAA